MKAYLIISRERCWRESLINFLNREARALLLCMASCLNAAVFKIVRLQSPIAIRCSSRGESCWLQKFFFSFISLKLLLTEASSPHSLSYSLVFAFQLNFQCLPTLDFLWNLKESISAFGVILACFSTSHWWQKYSREKSVLPKLLAWTAEEYKA